MLDESRKNKRRISYPKRPRRTKSTCASSPSANAKLIRNIETTKQNLEKLAKKYKGINTVDGFLADLWYALGIQNQGGVKNGGKPSRYALYQMMDGTMLLISIRASAHNANAEKYIEHQPIPDKNISIVLQKKMRKNQFKSNPKVNLAEYVYVNQRIKDIENPLSKIAYSIINYLDTGKYNDLTGVAISHGNINENNQNKTYKTMNRIRLTESQLNRVIRKCINEAIEDDYNGDAQISKQIWNMAENNQQMVFSLNNFISLLKQFIPDGTVIGKISTLSKDELIDYMSESVQKISENDKTIMTLTSGHHPYEGLNDK